MLAKWEQYQNFSKEEFDCKHTGKNEMTHEFMTMLQELRTHYERPIKITSGYRDITHPIESKKSEGGYHTRGIACDIACNSLQAYDIIKLAMRIGFTGIGVNQKGNKRFIHLDLRDFPIVYSY
jgi:zinc D-Ala-D-Ala carboxypeptidase